MLVREVMTTAVVTLRQDAAVRDAARSLLDAGISSAPVVDEAGRLVGFASEADLIAGRTQDDPRSRLMPVRATAPAPPGTVGAVMSHPALTVRQDEDVAEAARLMLDRGVKALPVVEGHRVVGIVARRDLLRSLARGDDDVRADVLRLLEDLGLGSTWQVAVRDGVVHLSGADSPRRQRAAEVLARTVPGVVRVHLDEPDPG